jgi:hypothetical protein
MSDPNWISATNAHHPVIILSRIRAVFDVEASSRSTHFCGVVERRSKGYSMPLQTTLGLVRGATQPPGRNTILRRLIGLLPHWRERAYHVQSCVSWVTTFSKTSASRETHCSASR